MTTALAQEALYGPTPRKLGFSSQKTGRWGRYYVPRLPDGRRHWLLPDGEVTGPRYDYDRGAFTGDCGGHPWQSPWTPALTWHIASQIPGWCEPGQGRRLYELAAAGAPLGACVEVGAFKGLSSAWIGHGARSAAPDARVYCLDTFTGGAGGRWKTDVKPEFDANMEYAGLAGTCTAVQGIFRDTLATWTAPVGFLYIDGEHSYAHCRADFEGWSRHCVPGALIAFDDCIADYPGILRFQRELADSPRLELLGRTDAMVCWRYRP